MASATFSKSGENIARVRELDTTKKHGGNLRVFLRVIMIFARAHA